MALKIEPRTIRLYEFELQLIEKLKTATGKTEEELLLGYVRAGLMKERHENLTYEKLKQEAALALLEAEGEAAYSSSSESTRKPKSRKSKADDPIRNSDPPSDPVKSEPDLEAQFLDLAERFSLPELSIEQIQPSESYLIRGKKQIRVITIQQVKDGNTAQYQLYNSADQKLHTVSFKSLTNNLRGPIPSHLIAQVHEAVTDSE